MSREYYDKIGIGTMIDYGGNLMQYIDGSTLSPIVQEKKGEATGVVAVDTTKSATGPSSLKITQADPTPGAYSSTELHAHIRYAGGAIVRAGFNFNRTAGAGTNWIQLYFNYFNGATYTKCGIKFIDPAGTAEVTASDGSWTAVTLNAYPTGNAVWHNIEIEFNILTGEWIAVYVNGTKTDLSLIAMEYPGGLTNIPPLTIGTLLYVPVGHAATVNFDNILVYCL